MAKTSTNSRSTAAFGREKLLAALAARFGSSIKAVVAGGARSVIDLTTANDHKQVRLRVKTRRSGDWQASVKDGTPPPMPSDVPTFWVFVDLTVEPAAYYVVPDEEMRLD